MKRKINVFLLSLFTITALVFTACKKDNPTPETDCSNFEVVITQVANSNDQLVATPTGAASPFTYLWSDGSTENTLTTNPASSGTYSVTVTSSDGCTATGTFEITVDPCAYFIATITNEDSSLVATSTGGLAPFTYSWSSGETQATIVAMTDGNYVVTITDANGCTSTDDFQYLLDPCINSALGVTLQYFTDPSGNFLLANPTAGVPPYSYSWSNAPNNSNTTTDATNPGTYVIIITDANGCTASDSYTLTGDCPGFSVDIIQDSITTAIHFDAVITAGTAPFTYEWGGLASGSSSWVEFALGSSGPISVTVTDSNGCTTSDNDQF